MNKKTIAIDIDDVLSANAEGFAAFSNTRWGTNISVADYDENWAKTWNVSEEQAEKWADEFHVAEAMSDYRHFEEALPVLRRLAHDYRLIIVTSRRGVLKRMTFAWVEQHFPGIFDGIHHAGIFDNRKSTEALALNKAKLCQELDADYLIDDQLKHCFGAAECGMEALLFGDYPWNKTTTPLPKNIKRVRNWAEVEHYFYAKS